MAWGGVRGNGIPPTAAPRYHAASAVFVLLNEIKDALLEIQRRWRVGGDGLSGLTKGDWI
jgi:hypothetical protein